MAHSVSDFETRIHSSHEAVVALQGDEFREQMWRYVHQPGWTTPAEALLVVGMLEAIEGQAKTLKQMQAVTLEAAAAITSGARVTV
jgi:hypothetical protein